MRSSAFVVVICLKQPLIDCGMRLASELASWLLD